MKEFRNKQPYVLEAMDRNSQNAWGELRRKLIDMGFAQDEISKLCELMAIAVESPGIDMFTKIVRKNLTLTKDQIAQIQPIYERLRASLLYPNGQ